MAEGRWVGERPPPVRKQSNRGERTFKVKNSIGPGVNCGQHIHQYDLTIKAGEICVAA